MTTLEDHAEMHQDYCQPGCEFCDLDLQAAMDKVETDVDEGNGWWNDCNH